MANRDLKHGLYSGQFGPCSVDRAQIPGCTTGQFPLHDWSLLFRPATTLRLMALCCRLINGRMLGQTRDQVARPAVSFHM